MLQIIALSVVVVFGAAAHEEEEDPLSTYMHCLFVEKGCTDAQIAQLQMQVAGYVATIDDQEALGLGGPPDQVIPDHRIGRPLL